MFKKWLKTHTYGDREKYVTQRRKIAQEVKRSKNAWFQQKARKVEIAMRRGKDVWKGLRDIQRGRARSDLGQSEIPMETYAWGKQAHSNIGMNILRPS